MVGTVAISSGGGKGGNYFGRDARKINFRTERVKGKVYGRARNAKNNFSNEGDEEGGSRWWTRYAKNNFFERMGVRGEDGLGRVARLLAKTFFLSNGSRGGEG